MDLGETEGNFFVFCNVPQHGHPSYCSGGGTMRRPFLYPKEQICPDSRALRAGRPFAGGQHPTPELRVRQRPGLSGNTPELELPKLETPRPLDPRSGKGLDSIPPTHPNISDLSHIRQEPQETVHHYWARLLLVMKKVKDCREEDAILFFCNNCTDK